jgi:hypothetical protein
MSQKQKSAAGKTTSLLGARHSNNNTQRQEMKPWSRIGDGLNQAEKSRRARVGMRPLPRGNAEPGHAHTEEISADVLRGSRTPSWAAHRDQEQKSGSKINELKIQTSSGKSHSTDSRAAAWRKTEVEIGSKNQFWTRENPRRALARRKNRDGQLGYDEPEHNYEDRNKTVTKEK